MQICVHCLLSIFQTRATKWICDGSGEGYEARLEKHVYVLFAESHFAESHFAESMGHFAECFFGKVGIEIRQSG